MGSVDKARQDLIDWTVANGTVINEFVSIRSSSLGGTGAFFDLKGYIAKNGELDYDNGRIEIMRIPRNLTISLDSIVENLLTPQTEYDSNAKEDYLQQSGIFTSFIKEFYTAFNPTEGIIRRGLNETNILVGEIQILICLKIIREKLISSNKITNDYKVFLENSPFTKYDKYLDLLLATDVSLIKFDEYYDDYNDIYKYLERPYRRKVEQIKLTSVLKVLFSIDLDDYGIDISELIDINILRKIDMTVISRILEIPEELPEELKKADDDNDDENELNDENHDDAKEEGEKAASDEAYGEGEEEEAEEEEQEKYAFAVSSTMVPIVDFVNHNIDLTNAIFDTDRENGDILLNLKTETLTSINSDEFELFISYDETEDILKFILSYGFLPKNSSPGVLCDLPIEREFLLNYQTEHMKNYDYNLGVILKWFGGVSPSVQFLTKFDPITGKIDDIRINLDQNLIVWGFTDKLKYNEEVKPDLAKCLSHEYYYDENDEPLKEWIEVLEASPDIDSINAYQFTPFEYIEDPADGNEDNQQLPIIYQLITNSEDDESDILILRFIDFLVEYFNYRLTRLNEFLDQVSKDGFKGYSLVVNMVNYEKELIETFVKKVEITEDKLDLILGVDELEDDWVNYRLGPTVVTDEIISELHELSVADKLKNTDINEETQ